MNRDLGSLLTPLVAIVLFALVAFQTTQALRASGAWSSVLHTSSAPAVPAAADPFAPIGALLDHPQPPLAAATMRDPFSQGFAPVAVSTTPVKPVVHKPVVLPPPPRPLLTAIVWDSDPRAIVRWQGRDLTVRRGGLFDDFQVLDITHDQVTLTRGTETIVLQRKPQGD